MSINRNITEILDDMWPKNKAKGIYAQTTLARDVLSGLFGSDAHEKIFSGCWFLSPKESDFYHFRFSFFVHPFVEKKDKDLTNLKNLLGDKYRPFHAMSEFLNNAGIGAVYVVAQTQDGTLPLEQIISRNYQGITWHFACFENGEFVQRNILEFFTKWPGDRGRPTYRKRVENEGWETQTRENFHGLNENKLIELLLNELFLTGFIKAGLRKPLNDPYDIDSFLLSISQRHILPIEIKEKFPAENQKDLFFGIDAGRVMMLLRICLPNDANAIYLIREVRSSGEFVGWKYITLSDLIMSASWNLQAGGRGMGGQSTQTIRLPYEFFKQFDTSVISENNLQKIGSLPKEVKNIAKDFGLEITSRFYK